MFGVVCEDYDYSNDLQRSITVQTYTFVIISSLNTFIFDCYRQYSKIEPVLSTVFDVAY